MAELPLPNLDDIPDTPAPPKPGTGSTQVPPTPSAVPARPTFTPPKLPTLPRPNVHIPTVPWRVIAAAVVVLLVSGTAVFFLFFWRATVTVTSMPSDALIRFNDQTATGELRTNVAPGNYQLSVERQDFIGYQQAVTAGTNELLNLTITLRALPEPQRLSDQIVQFMVLDAERTSLLYLAPHQQTAYRLFTQDLVAPVIDEITPATFTNLTDLIWSPNRQLAFFKQGEVTKQYDFKRYDLLTQETHDWPDGIGSIDWRPDGEKVAYAYEPVGGERTIIRATTDNGDQERIFNLRETTITRPILRWSPDAKYLSLLADKLYILDTFSKELRTLTQAGTPRAVRWLPTSDGLLAEGSDGQLTLVRLDDTVTSLGVDGTIEQLVPFQDGTSALYTRDRNSRTEFFRLTFADQVLLPYLFKAQAPLAPTNMVLSDNEQHVFFVSAGNPYALLLDDGQYK